MGISSLGVDVEPRPPRSYEPIFLEEPLRNRVVCEVRSVGKANGLGYQVEWVRFVGKDVFNSPAKLARGCNWLCLVMFRMSEVQTSFTLALDVQTESLSERCRLPDIQTRISEFGWPPVSILDVDSNLVGAFEYYCAI